MAKSANSDSKLWVEVPRDKLTFNKSSMETSNKEVRPTVTTLLRHHQMVEKQEKAEREKVEGYVQGGPNFDYDSWKYQKELQDRKEKDTEGAKRLLKSKLAYHKAITATRQVHNDKHQVADFVRNEGRKLKTQFEIEQEAEMDRKRMVAAELKEEMWEPKRLHEELALEKRRIAQEFKEETYRLQNEARKRELDELVKRKEQIQRIQASKMALKQSATQSPSPAGFLGALPPSPAEIKIKLTKDSQAKELEEKRRKVQQAKEQRLAKLAEVEHKLTSHLNQTQAKRELEVKFRDMPHFKHSINEDPEINRLAKELENLKNNNCTLVKKNLSRM